jgi:hypothetical protein
MISNVAANRGVDISILHRALVDLQRRLYDAIPTVARGRGVERYVTTHLVVAGDAELLVDALPAYDDRVRTAAGRVHRTGDATYRGRSEYTASRRLSTDRRGANTRDRARGF